jgi:hypothetical protein
MKFILGFFRMVTGILAMLFSILIAKFTPAGKIDWSLFYRGSFRNKDGTDALLTVSGDMIEGSFCRNADNGYLPIAKGLPGNALSPDQSIHVQILHNATLLSQSIALTDLFDKPLGGYVELMAEREHLKVRICRYTWGHSLSIGTGQSHRSVKTVAEKTLQWNRQTVSVDDVQAAGLAFYNSSAY